MPDTSIVVSRLDAVSHWQRVSGVTADATTQVGFSQRSAPPNLRFHLIHGQGDQVVPTRASMEAAQALQALGAQVTPDVPPGLGHGIDNRVLRLVLADVGAASAAAD